MDVCGHMCFWKHVTESTSKEILPHSFSLSHVWKICLVVCLQIASSEVRVLICKTQLFCGAASDLSVCRNDEVLLALCCVCNTKTENKSESGLWSKVTFQNSWCSTTQEVCGLFQHALYVSPAKAECLFLSTCHSSSQEHGCYFTYRHSTLFSAIHLSEIAGRDGKQVQAVYELWIKFDDYYMSYIKC